MPGFDTTPAVRASHLKEDLEALSKLEGDVEARVRARIAPATLAAIEGATRVEWLPLEHNVELAEAVHAVAGERGSRQWAQVSLLISMQGFFRPLLDAVMALFDPTPPTIYRFLPRAWPAVYRACGSCSVHEDGEDRLRIEAREFPPALLCEPFLLALAGTFESAFALSRYEGEVALVGRDVARGEASFVATWRMRRGVRPGWGTAR